MVQKIDPRDFLLNTDYELDKIILFESGDFDTEIEIPHNLPFIPLIFGVWSTDSGFAYANTLGWTDSSSDPGYTPTMSVGAYATSDKIVLTPVSNNGARLYYRVYGFEPSNSMKNAPATSTYANQFVLNTNYNYCKLLKTGYFINNNEEYVHNLGYMPQVMAWIEDSFSGEPKIQPLEYGSNPNNFGLFVNSEKIKVGELLDTPLIDKIHWRVYYDEA